MQYRNLFQTSVSLCAFFGLGLKFPSLENNQLHLGSVLALPPCHPLIWRRAWGNAGSALLWPSSSVILFFRMEIWCHQHNPERIYFRSAVSFHGAYWRSQWHYFDDEPPEWRVNLVPWSFFFLQQYWKQTLQRAEVLGDSGVNSSDPHCL